MLVLAAEYKEFVAFVQSRCVTYMEVPVSVCQVGDATTKRFIELYLPMRTPGISP